MKDKENLEKYKENVIEEIKKLPIVKEKQNEIILKVQRAKNKEQLEEILKETLAEEKIIEKCKEIEKIKIEEIKIQAQIFALAKNDEIEKN